MPASRLTGSPEARTPDPVHPERGGSPRVTGASDRQKFAPRTGFTPPISAANRSRRRAGRPWWRAIRG